MYPVFERLSMDKMYKSEIGIIKRTLKDLIKDNKVDLVDNIWCNFLFCLNVGFDLFVPIEYSGDVYTYDTSDYIMIGLKLSEFRVNKDGLAKAITENFFIELRLFLMGLNSHINHPDWFENDYPEIYEIIKELGFEKTVLDNKEILAIMQEMGKKGKDFLKIKNLDKLNSPIIRYLRGNGLGIKDNDFFPIFLFSKSDYKLYYFDKNKFTANDYYRKIPQLIKNGVLVEIGIDNISSLRPGPGKIGSPQVCLLRSFR